MVDKAKLEDLGYTHKWLKYGVLDQETLDAQFAECKRGEDWNTEHYRYSMLRNWLSKKAEFTDSEVENFLELALEDDDQLMAGSAVKELFTSRGISDHQFDVIKEKLPVFGDWTTKLIRRETLLRRLRKEKWSQSLMNECVLFSKEFKDHILIRTIVERTDDLEVISHFANGNHGKKTENLASQKLRRILKAKS